MPASVMNTRPQRPGPGEYTSYTHALCPYAQRVAIVLLEKQVPHKRVHIDLSRKPRWYAEVNPRGLVPCLEHEGGTVVESLDILEWLEANVASSQALVPESEVEEGHMRAAMRGGCIDRVITAGLSVVAGRSGRYWGIGTDPTEGAKAAFTDALTELAEMLQRSGGPYLMGPRVTLADCALVPFLERFFIALGAISHWRVEEDEAGRIVRAYLDAVRARPAFKAASPDDELMLKAMRKHMSLDFFDYESYGDLALHPHWDGGLIDNGIRNG